MNGDLDGQVEDHTPLDLSLESDEWELPVLSTDENDSFDFVPPTATELRCQGPSHPLPKVKPHTRIVRPRVEPLLGLRHGVPTRNDSSSPSTSRSQPQLQVSSLQPKSTLLTSYPDVPRSVSWMSLDDLVSQPPPPGGRGAPISVRSGLNKNSLDTAPPGVTISEPAMITKVSGPTAFNPPHRHQTSHGQNSATALVRTKQPSSNKQIVQLFQTLLSVFGTDSTLGSQLSSSSFGEMHLHRVIDSYAASTLMKYLSAVGNFIRTCKELGMSFMGISDLQLADILITVQLSKSSDSAGCSSTGTLKALRWWQKVAGIESWKHILFAQVIQSLLTIRIPRDRSESVPIPLWCVVQWEKRVLTSACPEHMVLILGFFLVLIWGSLRFSDAQRVDLRSLVYDGENLRGLSWRTKTTHRGQAFGVLAQGLLSKRSYHWLHKYLLTLDAVLTRVGMEYMDYLMPDVSGQQGIVLPLQPMSYASALKWLRHCIRAPWKQQQSTLLDPEVFTVHSCKATLLSWSAQQAHLLTEEERLQQGHHRISAKGSLRLYSRDDVYPALRLQTLLRNAVLQGWRPSVPQHRGGQSALAEPKVDTIEQYSKVGSMDFHWFGFGTPQPLEGMSTPPPVDDSVNSDSSLSSSSSESDAPMEETPKLKKKQSASKPRAQYSQICCGVTHFGVGHAMIPDDSAQDSSLYWQELP